MKHAKDKNLKEENADREAVKVNFVQEKDGCNVYEDPLHVVVHLDEELEGQRGHLRIYLISKSEKAVLTGAGLATILLFWIPSLAPLF